MTMIEDLAEEERLRARARESELLFRSVVEHATDGIVMLDEQGLITYFNRAAEEMFGHAPDRAIGVLRDRIDALVADHHAALERSALAWHDNLADKYGTALRELEAERDAAAARLDEHLAELGYE